MLPTTYGHNEKNKENFEFISTKQIDDDAESSHSDCLIIEPDIPTTTSNDPNFHLSSMGILPNNLVKDTNLLLFYENRTMDVHLAAPITNLENEQRITISHLSYLYSIPKRHLYLSTPCDIQNIAISRQSRILYISSLTKKYSLGFICEIPSIYNHSRHLILFDDGSAGYTMENDRIHLCLCQDFEQTSRLIESKIIRENFEELLFKNNLNKKQLQIYNYVCVKKFDDKYHNAQIIDIDCSIIKLKFYERQAKTEIWMHQHSLLINDTIMSPIDIASPVILQNKRKHDEISTIPELNVEVPSNDNYCRETARRMKSHPVANDAPLVTKRKPGRPRKVTQTVVPLVTKRKRGRPRKVIKTVKPLVTKRKRGRPRKKQTLY